MLGRMDLQVLVQALKSRLFALRVADEIMEIVNPPDFKPWVF
jgi:ribosomal protein L29